MVVNLVAIANPALYTRDPAHVFEVNFLSNLQVARDCMETATRLVQFSTSEVYGPTWLSLVPDGLLDQRTIETADVTMHEDETSLITGPIHKTRWIYSASKQLLERAIHAYGVSSGLDYTIIRPFNFVGPRFDTLPSERGDNSPRMFAQFMYALLHGTRISLVDGGHARRTFTYIDDAVECIGRIVLDTSGVTSREVFNVGNPANEATVEEFAQLMRDIYAEQHWDGSSPLSEMQSVSHEEFFGAGYEDIDRRIPDISKARALLDWEPAWGLHDLVAATMDAFVGDFRARSGSESPTGRHSVTTSR